MNVTEVENIIGEIVHVELESDGEGSVLGPLGDGMEELGLVVVESEVFGVTGDGGDTRVVTVLSEVLPILEVHGGRARHVVAADAGRTGGDDPRLELVDIGVSAVGEVREAEGVIVVRAVSLNETVRLPHFHAERGVNGAVAFLELIISQFASVQIDLGREGALLVAGVYGGADGAADAVLAHGSMGDAGPPGPGGAEEGGEGEKGGGAWEDHGVEMRTGEAWKIRRKKSSLD
mmetsp:Transcript_7741/g.22750  ORF Transcript_7741/g.22750 Transcript_7741/m.22750 type:complete len:233 (+) Transcript_7741:994-1692(+)